MAPPPSASGPVTRRPHDWRSDRITARLNFWYRLRVRRVCSLGCLLAAVACVASAGCSRNQVKLAVRDTEDRAFQLSCPEPDKCEVSSALQPKPSSQGADGARPGFVLHQTSRLYTVCDVWLEGSGSFSSNAADCRALVCKSDAECPPAKGLPHGSCASNLCIEPSGAISSEDAVVLCLAGTGVPGAASTRQIERVALGSNCGTPCRVPAVCRQP
jgi:hypothetical protein